MIASITPISTLSIANLIVSISPDSTLETPTRRQTKTATLDGNSSIVDLGYSATDVDIVITLTEFSKQTYEDILTVLKGSPLVSISLESGIYNGVLSRLTKSNTNISITFRAKEKLNA